MNKMISYIARTHEKVNAIKLTGQHAGVDLQVMETVSIVSASSGPYALDVGTDTNIDTGIRPAACGCG